MRSTRRMLAALLGCLVVTPGCASEQSDDPEFCQLDALGCGAGLHFELDDDCQNDEPLRVELGHGVRAFSSFAADETPPLGSSASGGQGPAQRHVSLALRIENPDADHRLFGVELLLESRPTTDGGTAAGDEQDLYPEASRRIVLGEPNMQLATDGSLTQWSLNLRVGCAWCIEGDVQLRVTVRDSCDRRAEDTHAFIWMPDSP